jgi:hypothetical protein
LELAISWTLRFNGLYPEPRAWHTERSVNTEAQSGNSRAIAIMIVQKNRNNGLVSADARDVQPISGV